MLTMWANVETISLGSGVRAKSGQSGARQTFNLQSHGNRGEGIGK